MGSKSSRCHTEVYGSRKSGVQKTDLMVYSLGFMNSTKKVYKYV